MTGRFISLISLLTLCFSASGQNVVTDFASTLKGKCASFGYSYSISGQVPVSGSGTVKLQGESFTMKGDGLEIYCDGKDRWTVDTEAEECYIESVDTGTLDVESNPALLVGAVDKAFKFQKVKSSTFNGKSVREAVLIPSPKNGNIKEVSLFLTASEVPAGAMITTEDGTFITITVKDFVLSGMVDSGTFSFNTKNLSKNFIITDLR